MAESERDRSRRRRRAAGVPVRLPPRDGTRSAYVVKRRKGLEPSSADRAAEAAYQRERRKR